jgi:hypothetical protein
VVPVDAGALNANRNASEELMMDRGSFLKNATSPDELEQVQPAGEVHVGALHPLGIWILTVVLKTFGARSCGTSSTTWVVLVAVTLVDSNSA